MTAPSRIALVAAGEEPFGSWTVEALAELCERVIVVPGAGAAAWKSMAKVELADVDPSSEAGWTRLAETLKSRFGRIDVLACAPAAASTADHVAKAIEGLWLALRCATPLLPKGEGAAIVVECLQPTRGDFAGARQAAILEAARLTTAAALLDASQLGAHPRSNRLVLAPSVAEGALKSAVRLLVDERSSFMTGTEIRLSDRPAPAASPRPLEGKVIAVTGATSGIGRAIAIEAGARGGRVVVCGRKLDLAEETLAQVRAAGGDGMIAALDVTDPAAWAKACELILAREGSVHGLVNNAGESRHGRIDALGLDDLKFLLAVNFRGPVAGIEAFLPALEASGRGAIVNISSVAGVRAAAGNSAYGATKGAIVGASLGLADVLAPRSVRINSVQPGLIWSDSVADSMGEEGAQRFRAFIEPKTPLGRVGRPEEIARVVAYLLSDEAAAIDGQAINVSGGLELSYP